MTAQDDGYVRFRCGECGQKLKAKKTSEGGDVMPCPRCGATVTVPLMNLQSIAKGTDMAETGQPGRLNVDPELVLKRLRGEGEKAGGPGSVGGPPSLRQDVRGSLDAFGRVQELDQLAASLSKVDGNAMGQVQRIYRNRELNAAQREVQVQQVADRRRQDIRELLANRLAGMRMDVRSLDAQRQRLMRSDLDRLDRMKLACEALEFYARHVLGIQV